MEIDWIGTGTAAAYIGLPLLLGAIGYAALSSPWRKLRSFAGLALVTLSVAAFAIGFMRAYPLAETERIGAGLPLLVHLPVATGELHSSGCFRLAATRNVFVHVGLNRLDFGGGNPPERRADPCATWERTSNQMDVATPTVGTDVYYSVVGDMWLVRDELSGANLQQEGMPQLGEQAYDGASGLPILADQEQQRWTVHRIVACLSVVMLAWAVAVLVSLRRRSGDAEARLESFARRWRGSDMRVEVARGPYRDDSRTPRGYARLGGAAHLRLRDRARRLRCAMLAMVGCAFALLAVGLSWNVPAWVEPYTVVTGQAAEDEATVEPPVPATYGSPGTG